jgi:hypothetical protein
MAAEAVTPLPLSPRGEHHRVDACDGARRPLVDGEQQELIAVVSSTTAAPRQAEAAAPTRSLQPPAPGASAVHQDVLALPSTSADHYPYEVLDALVQTTPWSSLSNLMTSYSVANRLMFFPPPPSYGFTSAMHRPLAFAAALSSIGGTHVGEPTRVYVPWSHVHVDGSGRTLGRSPVWMRWVHGISNYITCTRVDFDKATVKVAAPPREPNLLATRVTFTNAKPRSSSSEEAPASSPSLGAPLAGLISQPSPSTPSPLAAAPTGGDGEDPGSPRLPGAAETSPMPPSAFSGNDGVSIPRSKRRLVLCFHGNAADCNGDLLQVASEVVCRFDCPATLLLVEYPGYGNMDGDPSAALIQCAAERVVQFIFATSTTELTPDCITLLAHSMGTGIVMHLLKCITDAFAPLRGAQRCGNSVGAFFVGGVILASPFSSIRSVLVPSTDLKCTTGSCGGIMAQSSPPSSLEAKRKAFEEHHLRRSTDLGLFDGVGAYRQFQPVDVPTRPASSAEGGATAPTLDDHWIYRYGSRIMLDRFCSSQAAYDMQRRHDCFSHTTLLLMHGVDDDTIPASHSLRLCMAVAEGDNAAAMDATRSSSTVTSNPKALCLLLAAHDHNNIVGSLSLQVEQCWPTLKTLPGFCPLYIAAPPTPSTDGSSGVEMSPMAPKAMGMPQPHRNCIMMHGNEFLLTSLDAYADSTSTVWSLALWLKVEIVCQIVVGAWILACGVVHIIAAQRHYDVALVGSSGGQEGASVPNSHVVMIWAAFECTSWWLSAWVKHMEARCALTWRATTDENAPSRGACMFYYAMRGLTGVLAVSIGVVFGFTCAFSSDVCGSLDMDAWRRLTSASTANSDVTTTFATDVMKWSMVGAAGVHAVQVVAFLLRHH